MEISEVNKKAVESLIKAGALDCLDVNRAAHLAVYEGLVESAQNSAKKNIAGQMSLFQISSEEMNSGDTSGTLPDVNNFSKDILLAMEKEMLGVYITDHPLSEYAEKIEKYADVTSEDLAAVSEEEHHDSRIQDGMTVTLAGMIAGKKNQITKNNKMMAFVNLEDLYGEVEIVVFPNVYERCSSAILEDNVVVVKGKLNFKEDEMPKVLADSVVGIHEVEQHLQNEQAAPEGGRNAQGGRTQGAGTGAETVKVRIPQEADEQEILGRLQEIFKEYPGNTPVLIYLQNGKIVRTGAGGGVYPSIALFDTVAEMVGRPNIKGRVRA